MAMSNSKDRILVVENDAMISDLISRQALQSLGYNVQTVGDATSAIPQTLQFSPDVLIVDLNLPGLSGKDFLVALNSQGITTPVIVIAQKGSEGDIIQAFRLGATDYLLLPVRETEVVSAVERVLNQVRERRERDHLARQLQQTNQELQLRLRELTTIFSVGKAVTSITDQRALFDKIVEGSIKVTQADLGWFLLRDDTLKAFVLAAHRSLPTSLVGRLNQPWDDGISSLVAMSGESLSIHGDPLKRFKISSLGQAALISPIKVQKQVIGLLVVLRKTVRPFGASEQHLLEAVCDYASISLVNSRLFRALEDRARSQQMAAENAERGEKIKNELLQSVNQELHRPLAQVAGAIDRLAEGQVGKLLAEQRQMLSAGKEQLQELNRIMEAITAQQQIDALKPGPQTNLVEIARLSIGHMQHYAQQNGLSLISELSSEPIQVQADPIQLIHVVDSLLANAIKYTAAGGQVWVRVDRLDNQPHLAVRDTGIGIETRHLQRLFDHGYHVDAAPIRRFGGLGISLSLIKEIVTAFGGKIWAESQTGRGSIFHLIFAPAK